MVIQKTSPSGDHHLHRYLHINCMQNQKQMSDCFMVDIDMQGLSNGLTTKDGPANSWMTVSLSFLII